MYKNHTQKIKRQHTFTASNDLNFITVS